MKEKLTLEQVDLRGRRVVMRVDFNVPLDEQGNITDDTRIQRTLPSLLHILEAGASIVILSHLGRPKGEKKAQYSLLPCKERLAELLKRPVQFVNDCIGEEVEKSVRGMEAGDVLLLENLRFYPDEEKPQDDSFARQLAKWGDVYVNDAFGVCHRSHSSVVPITRYFQDCSAAGFLLNREITLLSELLLNPERPFYAIIGGKKVSSKIGVLNALIQRVDGLLIGGAMAFTFFKAQGIDIGNSLFEAEYLQTAKTIVEQCQNRSVPLFLPLDILAANEIRPDAETTLISLDQKQAIPSDFQGLDIGPRTIQSYQEVLKKGKTILWNGPLGVAEIPLFARGTDQMAVTLSECQAKTVIGGGDSIAAIKKAGVEEAMDHLSTGGGATLEYIEHGSLPGVDALTDL